MGSPPATLKFRMHGSGQANGARNTRATFSWMQGENIRKILIIRTSALGDVVHALPALSALKEAFPAAALHWLVEPLAAPLLVDNALVDRAHVFDRKKWTRSLKAIRNWGTAWKQLATLVRTLRRERFDLVIDFQANFRSGLTVFLIGGKHRLGFHPADCREAGGWFFSNLRAPLTPLFLSRVDKNLHLVGELGWEGERPKAVLPIPQEDQAWAEQLIQTLPGKGPVILVHPTVSRRGMIKQWPAESYRRLCDLLKGELDARVLLTWGPGELDQVESIGRQVIAPPTERLFRLAALILKSDLMVASDTGCLHLASALEVPLVGIYGPKSPRVYRPTPLRGRLVQSSVPCSPCNLRICEHRICMASIAAEEVFEAVRQALMEARPHSLPVTNPPKV